MKRILIFEGPDGAGKSTLAAKVAEQIGTRVVHHGPYPEVTDGLDLAKIYRDSMAEPGDVVLDRCWISEKPYGIAFRGGADRLNNGLNRYLDKCAFKFAGYVRVFLCMPSWETVKKNYLARRGKEYLDSLAQLRLVYDYYRNENLSDTLHVRVINPFLIEDLIDD